MVGIGFFNMVDDGLFRTSVHFGYEVVTTLFINFYQIEAVCRFHNHFASRTGSAKGDINHWLHVEYSSR